MKTLLNILVLALISLFISTNVRAQFFYPSASLFSPTANPYRGSKTDPLQWLETHDAQIFSFLISINDLKSELTLKNNPTTLLVPTDKAFANLSPAIRDRLSEPGQLESLLKYHFIPQIISDEQIKQGQVGTLEGNSLEISGQVLSNQNTEIKLNEAVAEKSIGLNDNLIIIVIDQVLLPPNF